MKFSSPTAFMAQKKDIVDEAYPGDIVGLPDNGTFKIGDTLTEGEELHFRGLPSFSSRNVQIYRKHRPNENQAIEQRHRAIDGTKVLPNCLLTNSTVARLSAPWSQLQFEVIQYRLLHEYGAQCRWEPIHLYKSMLD